MERLQKFINWTKNKIGIKEPDRTVMTDETNELMDRVLTKFRNYIYDEALSFVAERGPPYIMLPEDIEKVVNAGPIYLKVTKEWFLESSSLSKFKTAE